MASSLEAVDQLPARELGELLLVVADLMDVEMREAGVLVLADQVEVRLGIGAGGRRLGDVGDGHVAGSLLEVARRRKLLAAGAGEREVRPELVRPLVPGLLVLAVGHVRHADLRLATPTSRLERFDDLLVARRRDQAVSDSSGEL